jgi:hypothetical protein
VQRVAKFDQDRDPISGSARERALTPMQPALSAQGLGRSEGGGAAQQLSHGGAWQYPRPGLVTRQQYSQAARAEASCSGQARHSRPLPERPASTIADWGQRGSSSYGAAAEGINISAS